MKSMSLALEMDSLAAVMGYEFIQRWDLYPKQLDDGRYVSVKEKLQHKTIVDHLSGAMTLGMYLLDKKSRGRHLIFDADDAPGWRRLVALQKVLDLMKISSYLEKSRRGGHLWFFLRTMTPAKLIRQFGKGLLFHFRIGGLELFPKQDQLAEGPGSLIKLPFGIHRKSNLRYGFFDVNGLPIAARLREQLLLFEKPRYVPEDIFNEFRSHAPVSQVEIRPAPIGPRSTDGTPSNQPKYERIKAAISTRYFIGQYVELAPSGIGLCPFHDDQMESFSVNSAKNYWYCFGCEKGGSILDFWMNYRECSFQTAVKELETLLL